MPKRAKEVEAPHKHLSVIQPYQEHDSKCGYCGSKKGRVSFGMDAKRLTCIDYQALIDAGWRRSGTWTYLPTNSTACCPNYTIRLDVTKFKPARSQKRAIRKLTALLRCKDPLAAAATANPNPAAGGGGAGGGAGAGAATATTATAAAADASADASAPTPPLKKQRRRNGEAKSKGKSKQKAKVVKSALPPLSARATKVMATAKERLMAAVQRLRIASSWDESAVIDPSLINVSPATAQVQRVAACHLTSDVAMKLCRMANSRPRPLAEALVQQLDLASSPLSVTVAGPGFLNFTIEGEPITAKPPAAPTTTTSKAGRSGSTHASPSPGAGAGTGAGAGAGAGVGQSKATAAQPDASWSRITVDMVPACFDEECFQLYKKYQVAIHGDKPEEVTVRQYKSFLVESPLIPAPFDDPAPHVEVSDVTIDDSVVASLMGVVGLPHDAAVQLLRAGGGTMDGALRILMQGSSAMPGAHQAAVDATTERVKAAWQDGEGAGLGIPLRRTASTSAPAPAPAASSSSSAPAPAAPAPSMAPTTAATPAAYAYTVKTPGMADRAISGSDMHLGYGTFHQRYRVDGKLVAVAVVDVLPHCLSSVYIFYDPDLPGLQLGKFSALREIQWVQEALQVSPRFRWYYMGYYVHSCTKMKYKAEYQPSDLLCPTTLSWIPLASVVHHLDVHRFFSFADAHAGNVLKAAAAATPASGAAVAVVASDSVEEVAPQEAVTGPLAAAAKAAREEAIKPLIEPALLVLGARVRTMSELTAQGRTIVRGILDDLFPRLGADLAARMLIKLQ